MSDHYKSQITDEEVIKELIRDSKKREGRLPTEATRLKPNLNFFQRTVTSLVSNNTRVDKSLHTFKNEYLNDEKLPETSENGLDSPSKSSIDYAFEREVSLQRKIHFVSSLETYSSGLIKPRAKIEIKKINFVGASTNISNRQVSSNISKRKSKKIGNQKIFNVSSDSEEDKQRKDVRKIIFKDNNKTTCKTYPSKSERVEPSDVIHILSDPETVELSSSESDGQEMEKEVKKEIKKRKKEKKNEKLVEESEKSVKRKKHKRKRVKS